MNKSKKSLTVFALAVIALAVTACTNPFFPKPREINSGGRGTDTSLSVAIAVDVDGRDVTLTAVVTGSGWDTLSYQWFSNGVESSEGGAPLSGETEESYEPPTDIPGTTYYYVEVRNGRNAAAVSNTVGVVVNEEGYEGEPIEIIVSDPVDTPAVTIAAEYDEGAVTLTAFATVSDEGEISYQWYRSATDRSDRGTALARETRTTYTPPVTSNGTVYYYVRATNTLKGQTASAASHTVKITVQDGEITEVIVSDTVETPSVSVTAFTSGGVTLTASASVGDGGALSYQWYKNTSEDSGGGTPIAGAAETTYEPPAGGDGTTYYYVKVTNTLKGQTATATSNTVKIVTRYGEIVITEIAVSATAETPSVNLSAANDGGYVTITADASVGDGGELSYRWYKNTVDSNKNGALIAGAAETSYAPPTDIAGTAYYYVKVTNTLNGQTAEATSGTARVTVQGGGVTEVTVSEAVRTPTVTIAAAVTGRSVTIMAAASAGDGGTLSYQWYRNEENSTTGGALIDGATGIIYAPPTDAPGITYYYVRVTNTLKGQSASAASNIAGVTVPAGDGAIEVETFHIDIPSAVITAEVNGRDVTITLEASVDDGGTLSYQWYRNSKRSINSGAAIAGETGTTYTPPTDSPGIAYYYAKVTNTLGGRTAVSTSNIVGVTVPAGDGAVEILNVETSDADIPTVSVTAAVTGRSVTIMAAASVDDGGMLSYQWYRNEENNKNGTLVDGATGIIYAPPTDHPGTTYYYVQVTNTLKGQTASATSNTVGVVIPAGNGTIEIIETLDVETPTASIDADVTGRIVTITADAFVNDGGTLSYRWYSNTQRNTTGGTAVAGETGITYMPPTTSPGTTYYYVRVTNTLNGKTASAASNIVGVTVPADNGAIQVETFDVDIPAVTIAAAVTGRSVTITAAASVTDGGALSYQWYRNDQNNKNGTAIEGATGNIYAPPTSTPGTAYYYVRVTNTLHGRTAEAPSNTIGVTVPAGTGSIGIIETLDVDTPAVSIAADVNGRDVTITATAMVNDGGALSYQWYSNTQKSTVGGTEIDGETGETYAPPTDAPGTIYYYVIATNTLDGQTASAASNTIGVVVPEGSGTVEVDASEVDTPRVTIAAAVTGRSVTIMAAASVSDGGTLSYQWYRNAEESNRSGAEIFGATGNIYAPPTNVAGTMYYYVIAMNTLNGYTASALSNVVGVVVPPEGNIEIIEVEVPEVDVPTVSVTGSVTGQTVTLTVTASVTDGGTLSYQWYRNDKNNLIGGEEINGGTGTTYTATAGAPGTAAYYYVIATNTLDGKSASAFSNIMGVVVPDSGIIEIIEAEAPVVTIITTLNGPYPLGSNVMITASATVSDGGSLTYQWYSNTANNKNGTPLEGQTGLVYAPPTNAANTTYYYCVVTNMRNGKTAGASSNTVEITVEIWGINSAEVNVWPPSMGQPANLQASTTDAGYTPGTVAWTAGGTAHSGTFLGNTVYTASVTLTAQMGYAFAQGFAAKINGETATVTNQSDESVTISFTFIATLNKAVSSISVTSQPTKLAYYHGEELDLAGLEIKITYSDGQADTVTSTQLSAYNITTNPAHGEKIKILSHNGRSITVTAGLTATTNALTINKKGLTVTGGQHTKVYDGNKTASTITVTSLDGIEFDDQVSVTTVAGEYTSPNAGTTHVNIAALGGTPQGPSADYYTVAAATNVPVTGGGITKANLVVTWPTGLAVTYGGALTDITLPGNGKVTGVVTNQNETGTFAFATPSTAPGAAGTRSHSMTYTPTGTSAVNYNTPAAQNVSITVTKKALTVTVTTPDKTLIGFTGNSRETTYSKTATFNVTVSGLVGSENPGTVGVSGYGLSLSYTGTFANNTAKAVTITYDGATAVTSTDALSVGLTVSNTNYSTTAVVKPTIIDGQNVGRRIPVTENNISQFNTYANTTAGLTRHYKLTQDVTLTIPTSNTGSNWTPIGTGVNTNYDRFSGSFDGQKFTITNLTVRGSHPYAGMFGYIYTSGYVQNIGLKDVIISSTSGANSVYVGGVAGQTYGSGISNCFVTGSVSHTSGTTSTTGSVYDCVGGVVGANASATVSNCYSTASVSSGAGNNYLHYIGGVVGRKETFIYNCYSTGSVSYTGASTSSSNIYVGGVMGYNYSYATQNCVALNSSITQSANYGQNMGRVYGGINVSSINKIYAKPGITMTYNNGAATYTPNPMVVNGPTTKDGMDAAAWNTEAFWTTAGNWYNNIWDFTNVWQWNATLTRPILRGFTSGMQN